MSLFLETPDWVRPNDYPRLRGVIGMDFETMDPELKNRGASWAFEDVGKIVGMAFATPSNSGHDWMGYYPTGHLHNNMPDVEKTYNWLKHQLENPDPTLEIVVFNWLYEMGWLKRYGINPRCPVRDPGVSAALLDECRVSYNLNGLAKTYLGDGKYSSDLQQFAQAHGFDDLWGNLDKLPPPYVGPYAEQDARLAADLWMKLNPMIQQKGLSAIQQLEHDVLPVILDMRWRGVRVNIPRAEQTVEQLKAQEKELHKSIRHIVGRDVEIWAADSIADAFVLTGLEHPVTKAGKPSFTAEFLETHEHELPRMIVEARQINKLHSTFITNYFLELNYKGRIHANFSPLRSDNETGSGGAVTGRFTSSNPNLQNLPGRKNTSAKLIRGLLEPEEGDLWAACDYSSQEPRLTVHFAAISGCAGADKAVEQYRANPRTDYHLMTANLTGLKRTQAKPVNLGIPYGMGGGKLCKHHLHLPTRWAVYERGQGATYFDIDDYEAAEEFAQSVSRRPIEVAGEEGQQILDTYHQNLPYLKELMGKTTRLAETRGWIQTILGRRRHFLGSSEKVNDFNRKKAFPYKALNALIQGSGADMTKKAMVDLYKEGYKIMVTVHDELGLSVGSHEEGERACKIMEDAVPLVIPNVVDMEIGETWAASMGLPWEDD